MRIIGGRYKRQPLIFPQSKITRPTTDRIRESVFNILEHSLLENGFNGLSVLDAFAGTGALGLEAASRGAHLVCFTEKEKLIYKILLQNIKNIITDENSVFVLNKNILDSKFNIPFDVVFLDPPFQEKHLYKTAIDHLKKQNKIHQKTIIYTESDKNIAVELDDNLIDERLYGNIKVQFWKCSA